MTFGGRLLLAMVAILSVTVLGTMVAADRWIRSGFEASLRNDLEREARVIAGTLPRDTAALRATARRLGAALGRRVSLIDSTGRVVGDSDFDDASLRLLDDHSTRPEVLDAARAGVGHSRRFSNSTNRVELKTAVRAWPGYVRISAPVDQIETVLSDAQRAVVFAALAALALGIVLAWFGGREVGRPLGQLAAAARSLAGGRPPVYPASTVPEVRQLVRAFRAMQEELAVRMDALLQGREETTALVESMVEGVVAVDPAGEVVFCNSALRALLNYEPEAKLPNLRELFRTPEARRIVDDVLGGSAVLGREIILDTRIALVTARPLPTGGAVVCLHDITDLRRLETVRRDFVANVSHELKTPLTSITGYADILATDAPDTETTARFLEVIQTNARRMQHLVDDLLDLARLESGSWQPDVRPVGVRTAAEAAWASIAARAAEAGVSLEIDGSADASVYADPEALGQVLTNLLDNAVRHTPSGGRITIGAQRTDEGALVTVSDTGSGIAQDHLPRVFERFYRVDPARSRAQGGTGLGLSIVRHLVEAHGGRVDLSSALGRGTTVRVFFPDPREPA